MSRAAVAIFAIGIAACAGSKPAPPVQPTTAAAAAPATTPAPALAANASSATPAPASASADDDATVLNAKRWRYAAYFNRLKHEVRDNWNPAAVWKALPEVTRSSLGTATRATTLQVELAADGKLVKVAVATSSGVPELDGEAIRAFQVSSPFDAWPSGLTPVGRFKFSFFFEVAGASSVGIRPLAAAPTTP